jgi:FkbM family methyltransferase
MDSRVFRWVRGVPLLVRRFGIIQACFLFLPEFVRMTYLSRWTSRSLRSYARLFRMRNSTLLLLRPFSTDLGIFHEIWDHERYTTGAIGHMAEDGIVVDVGAQVGLFSVYASKELKARRIVSVEPDHSNFELLSKNVHLNHIEEVTMVEAALAGAAGQRWIGLDLSNSGGHSFYRQGVSGRMVRVLGLTDLFESHGISKCSLLKLDCEGAEMEILESASDRLLEGVSAISLEYHLGAYGFEKVETLLKRMERLGFAVEVRPLGRTHGTLRGVRENRPLKE